jgi:zinc transport system permease protein
VTLSQKFNIDLLGYLFGDILAIDPLEVGLSTGLAAAVLLAIVLNYHQLMYMTFSPESARASGVRTGRLDLLLTVLTAVTVVLGMKVVGLLMVTALLVIPAAAGLQAAANFKKAVLVSALVALVSVVGGLAAAVALDLPASSAIVILSFLIFGMTFLFRKRRFF